ncbi:MAG: hypothetical protein AAFU49_21750 [Pseudomonadota bacterium]
MRALKHIALPLAAIAAFFSYDMRINRSLGSATLPSVAVTFATPVAAQTIRAQSRRVARRTARRTTRRQSYIRSLPAGCALRGAYHYCGGVYYQPVVQDGATVYIVVNP